jgi:hypothetical protein
LITEVQNFYTLYDATIVNGLRNVLELPSGTLATLTQNSLDDNSPLGVYSKSWLKFTQNELYLPEEVITHATSNKTDYRAKRKFETTNNSLVFDIYPSPANSYITVEMVELMDDAPIQIALVNTAGVEVLRSTKSRAAGQSQNLQTHNLASGQYFVLIYQNNELIQKQAIEVIH